MFVFRILPVFLFSVFFSISVFAGTASPSDASSSGLSFDPSLSLEDDLDYEEYLEAEGFNDVVPVYDFSSIESDVSEIKDILASRSEALSDDPDVYSAVSVLSDVRAINSLPDHDVVSVSGTFSGDQYTILFPASYRQYLWIGSDGCLYNIGPDSITGRAFPSGQFDSSSYNYTLFTFRSMLQNNASTIYNNSYLASMQYYYESSYNRLTSSTTYGNFVVDDDGIQLTGSYDIDYQVFYVLVVSMFLIGGVWLCFWKTCKR